MSRIKTWEILDEFWALAEPLIPASLRGNDKEYKRKPGGGTKQNIPIDCISQLLSISSVPVSNGTPFPGKNLGAWLVRSP